MTDSTPQRLDLLIHAADAGATFLSWILMEEPFTQNAARLDTEPLVAALKRLESSLITLSGDGGDTAEGTVRHALTGGALAGREAERDLARELSRAVLPTRLRELIAGLDERKVDLRLRITPSPRLARVPWELLSTDVESDEPKRLVEIAQIIMDPPVTVHADRSRLPRPWAEVRNFPALHIIDPALPDSARVAGYGQTTTSRGDLITTIGKARRDGTTVQGDGFPVLRKTVSRVDLAQKLQNTPDLSRLLYFGHISSSSDEPGSASLHLSDVYWSGPKADHDPSAVWGMSEPVRPTTDGGDGYAHPAQPGNHMPLSALDLLLGTLLADDPEAHALYGRTEPTPGHQIWPMPPRVAMIACEGGVDYRSAETFGLVMAMIDAGAELVTTTRGPLPTDYAFATLEHPENRRSTRPPATGPTTQAALAIDAAHREDDAVAQIRKWQLDKLRRWRATGDLADTPLVWAAVATTLAPARPDALVPAPDEQPTTQGALNGTHD
ncbi:MAG TPA: hypothetical protein PKC73_13220 [Dermatophilaceae bacterium]|nr:hypothetical protein [Dermatophilaceae bacterium]